MTPPLKAPRYLAGFRCLAQDCPDTCCAGFVVRLDADDLRRVNDAVGSDKDLRARKRAAIRTEKSDDGAVASLHQGDGCTFLDAQKLCVLIQRKGQDGIPDACALYPRTLSYFPDHVELRATAGCSVIAHSLVTDPASLELVPVEASVAARIPESGPRPTQTPYLQRREELLALGDLELASPGLLRERLATLALFGGAVEQTFHRETAEVDAEIWTGARQRYLGALQTDAARAWLGQTTTDDRTLGAQILFSVLMNLRDGGSRRFTTLLDAALGRYHQALPPGSDEHLFAALAAVVEQRATLLEGALGEELEGPLRRHALNEWRRVWFTQARSLPAHLFGLLLELAAIRTLLLEHPAVEAYARAKAAGNGEALQAGFTQALIDTLQIVSRRLGSTHGLMESLEEQLSPEALATDAAGRLRLLLAYC